MQKKNPLAIVQVESKESSSQHSNNQKSERKAAEARFERLWLTDPHSLSPERNSIERERIGRSWQLICEFFNPKDKIVVDIGCGAGVLAKRLRDAGAVVYATDIARNALKQLESEQGSNFIIQQEALPATKLADDAYDLVVCTDVLAELHPYNYRLAVSELSRVVKPSGFVLCSTPVDIHSEDAFELFTGLLETEFQMKKWVFSYHAYTIRLLNLLKAPASFFRASQDPEYRQQKLAERGWLGQGWFRINSSKALGYLWKGISCLLYPFIYLLEQKRWLWRFLEKVCRFLSPEAGISHVIGIGRRRPLFQTTEEMLEEAQEQDHPPFRKERRWE